MRLISFTFTTSVLSSLVFLLPLAAGCDDDHDEDDEPFATFQACFDDHAKSEGLTPETAIKICCLDHGIGDPPVDPNVVCGETQAVCETYVSAELADADAAASVITSACAGYLVDRTK
jgi:hypothetical protein